MKFFLCSEQSAVCKQSTLCKNLFHLLLFLLPVNGSTNSLKIIYLHQVSGGYIIKNLLCKQVTDEFPFFVVISVISVRFYNTEPGRFLHFSVGKILHHFCIYASQTDWLFCFLPQDLPSKTARRRVRKAIVHTKIV